jgi:hypothetical protein
LDVLSGLFPRAQTERVAPSVDLSYLQHAVGQLMDQHGLVVAAGPFTSAAAARIFFGKNKLITTAMTLGGAWMAIQAISGPALQLMRDQFGYLSQLLEG